MRPNPAWSLNIHASPVCLRWRVLRPIIVRSWPDDRRNRRVLAINQMELGWIQVAVLLRDCHTDPQY